MSGEVGVSGAFKDIATIKVGVGGTYKTVSDAWVGVGGVFKKWWPAWTALAASGTTSIFKASTTVANTRYMTVNPATGDVFVAGPQCVNKIDYSSLASGGTYTRPWVGHLSTQGDADGTTTAARFRSINGLVWGSDGNLYIAETNRVRKCTPAGVVTTIAGPSSTATGYTDGTGSAVRFNRINGMCEHLGVLYVAESGTGNSDIRQVTFAGVVTTQRSSLSPAPAGGLCADSSGFYFQGSSYNIYTCGGASGAPTLLAGSTQGYANGTGASAQFGGMWPQMVLHPDGHLYVCEGNRVRSISGNLTATPGVVSLVAGDTTSPTGATGSTLGTGTSARLNSPQGIGVQSDGSLLVGESMNARVIRIV